MSTAADDEMLGALAAELAAAARDGVPVEPLSFRHPNLGVADAYAIAQRTVTSRLAAGARLMGHKVGLTSFAMQEALGVSEPDFGSLLDDMLLSDGATTALGRWIQPRIEPEIAFLLDRPLVGPAVTAGDVRVATRAVAPALEIIDSRVTDWRITLVDTVADNASSAAFVVGPWVPIEAAPDLRGVEGVLEVNGVDVERGMGSAVLGNPAEAVAWLVNTLAALGQSVAAGAIVMPGSMTRAVTLAAGDRVRARFAGIGAVTIVFA